MSNPNEGINPRHLEAALGGTVADVADDAQERDVSRLANVPAPDGSQELTALRAHVEALLRQLGEAEDELIARDRAIDARDKTIAELTKLLEAATKPAN